MYIDITVTINVRQSEYGYGNPRGEARTTFQSPYANEIQKLDLTPAIRAAIQKAYAEYLQSEKEVAASKENAE